MNQLTDAERRVLEEVRASRCAPECSCHRWKQRLADKLRTQHPGIDDVTLARIILTVANHLSVAAMYHRLDGGRTARIAAGAAVELAALDLDCPLTDDPGTGNT